MVRSPNNGQMSRRPAGQIPSRYLFSLINIYTYIYRYILNEFIKQILKYWCSLGDPSYLSNNPSVDDVFGGPVVVGYLGRKARRQGIFCCCCCDNDVWKRQLDLVTCQNHYAFLHYHPDIYLDRK